MYDLLVDTRRQRVKGSYWVILLALLIFPLIGHYQENLVAQL